MDNGSLSAADVALLNRGDDFGFGGGGVFMWIFALLILAGGGFGGWNNNGFANAIGYENLATSNEVQRGFDNQNTMANQREILSAVTNGTAQSIAATNQTFHDTLGALNDKYSELQRDIAANAVTLAGLAGAQQQCCCDTKMAIQETSAATNAAIAQNRYDAAMNTASINANTTAQTQRILDAISQNKIEALQGKVNQLELQQAVAGVVRYPMQSTYCSGANPFCGCGYNGNI